MNQPAKTAEHYARQMKVSLSPININFVDEDGEVLQLQARPSEASAHVFDRYAQHKGTPFLLSLVMYEFRYNGTVVQLNVRIGSNQITR